MRLLLLSLVLCTTILGQSLNRPQRAQMEYYDKLYDDYLARMRNYEETVKMAKLKAAHSHEWLNDVVESKGGEHSTGKESIEKQPEDPFGKLPVDVEQKETKQVNVEEICRKFAPSVHLHCRGSTTDKHSMRCFSYFRDCSPVIPKDDPLYTLASIYKTLPKPVGAETEAAVVSEGTKEGFIPEQPALATVSQPFTVSHSSTVSQPSTVSSSATVSVPSEAGLDPPRVMTKVEKERLDMGCRRVMVTATQNCHGKFTRPAFQRSCQAYLSSCAHLIPHSNPLYNLAQASLIVEQVVPPEIPKTTTSAPTVSEVSSGPVHNTDRTEASKAQAAPTITAAEFAEAEKEAARAKAQLPAESIEVLKQTCDRFLPTVRKHCHGDVRSSKYSNRCRAYFQDCQRFITTPSDPLYEIAHAFDSGVGLNLGSWAVKGIPYYPVNEEGAIGSGYLMNIPFGSWGGGYSDHLGVRDYWSQYQEVGANWYDGKYGYKSGWSVPLVQSLGIEGDLHAVVSVPLKPGEFGKPIGVDVGGGVGPYYQQNHHVGVDWMDGQVNNNFGVGVPLAGVGVNTGVGVAFPGASTWLG